MIAPLPNWRAGPSDSSDSWMLCSEGFLASRRALVREKNRAAISSGSPSTCVANARPSLHMPSRFGWTSPPLSRGFAKSTFRSRGHSCGSEVLSLSTSQNVFMSSNSPNAIASLIAMPLANRQPIVSPVAISRTDRWYIFLSCRDMVSTTSLRGRPPIMNIKFSIKLSPTGRFFPSPHWQPFQLCSLGGKARMDILDPFTSLNVDLLSLGIGLMFSSLISKSDMVISDWVDVDLNLQLVAGVPSTVAFVLLATVTILGFPSPFIEHGFESCSEGFEKKLVSSAMKRSEKLFCSTGFRVGFDSSVRGLEKSCTSCWINGS